MFLEIDNQNKISIKLLKNILNYEFQMAFSLMGDCGR